MSYVPDNTRKPLQIRVPWRVKGGVVGAGDVVKRMTSAVGIAPCGSCQQRAALMNRYLQFVGRQR